MRARSLFMAVLGLVFLCFSVSESSAQNLVPTGTKLFFPHIADGSQGNGAWQTDFVFENTSSNMAQGQLTLSSENGSALTLGTNLGSGSSFNLNIPPRGEVEVKTTGSGTLVAGWAVASFNQTVVGTASFSFTTSQGTVATVGVLGQLSPKTFFLIPAEASTGIAIVNPSTTLSNTVQLSASDQGGSQVSSQTVTLSPGQHVSQLVSALFPGLSSNFIGTVRIRSTSGLGFLALAIGVVSNPSFPVIFSIQVIAYNELATSYSGRYNLVSIMDNGTVSLSNIQWLSSNLFMATLTVSSQTSGQSLTGPVLGNVDDFGLLYSFAFQLPGLPSAGKATAVLQSDGSFSGFFSDIGNGNYGSFSFSNSMPPPPPGGY